MMGELPFSFAEAGAPKRAIVHAPIPANITRKSTLLVSIATQLQFPDYFGENWDAFDECLRDLSWLPAGQVILDHADLPLTDDAANVKIYVNILADAARKMSGADPHPLLIVFPIEFRDQVSRLLRL